MATRTAVNDPAETLGASWQRLLELSAELRREAADGDWEAVALTARDRHRLFTEHFRAFPVGPDTADFYRQHLATLLEEEGELQTIAKMARETVMRDSVKALNNRRAIDAYQPRRT